MSDGGVVDGAEWRVDGFTEVWRLGEGAQGRVVLARHEQSGTPVAIKYLPPVADEGARERLRHEATMLGQADSRHVARLFQLVEGPGTAAIVMEAVDGVSLKELLERHGALGPEASLSVLKGSLLGLAAAHAVGVVHRDYKPANVVVPADGQSRLVDFGIATPAGQEAGGAGTAYYMAPEQWNRHVATPACDVYAATCVFVECVSGQRPFTGNRMQLMNAHLTGEIPVEAVPEALRPLVLRGMAKTPEERPQGAAVFVDELERIARETYGDDWEQRGVRALAASAVALAALFPLAAWLMPGAASAGGMAAGQSAGVAAAQGAGQAAGHAGNLAGAGKAGGTSAVKAFLGGGAGKTAAAVGAVVVVGAAAVAIRGVVNEPDPEPNPTATAKAAATIADVRTCQTRDPSGRPVEPSPGPATVQLPAQVKLPEGAAVYHMARQGNFIIGPDGVQCHSDVGISAGADMIGLGGSGTVLQKWEGSVGGIAAQLCVYFPGSPGAQGQSCTASVTNRQDLPTGVPTMKAMLGIEPPAGNDEPSSSYVSVTLATRGTTPETGRAQPLRCVMPWQKKDICTATLTYWFIKRTEGAGITEAGLDRVAERIGEYVAAAKR